MDRVRLPGYQLAFHYDHARTESSQIAGRRVVNTDPFAVRGLKSCYLHSRGRCQNAKFLQEKRVNFDSISATYWERSVCSGHFHISWSSRTKKYSGLARCDM